LADFKGARRNASISPRLAQLESELYASGGSVDAFSFIGFAMSVDDCVGCGGGKFVRVYAKSL